jgi:two-component system, cell cycle sensor histidine kinase and response regulator CckA
MSEPASRSLDPESIFEGESASPYWLVTLLESVPALLWETDVKLRFIRLLGGLLPSTGIQADLSTGGNISEIFSPADRKKAMRAHESALLGRTSTFEARVGGRDLQVNVKPLRARGGKILGVLGIALDMTERIFAERALRLSEHGYRSLVEEAPYAICRSTLGGALLQANRAMAEMLRYDAGAVSELLLRDLPLIFSPPGAFDSFQKTLLKNGLHPGIETSWLRRDGQAIQVRVSGLVVRNSTGKISHIDIFAENVTEIKRLEADLSQAQKMQAIGQLAGGVAHDFNNLLTVITGHVEMMTAKSEDDESSWRLGEIRHATERAAALTKQLLALSRRQVMQSRTVNLNEVFGRLMGILSRLIKENVDLEFTPEPELGSVKVDPNEIERAVLNLAVNAQDAMPDGGCLSIETANVRLEEQPSDEPDGPQAGDYVQVVVRDTGIGMDRDMQTRIFEPFFTTKRPNEGTGLGLAVVYGVVRQSGGFIRVESEPGIGTTFRIYLPRIDAPPTPAHPSQSSRALPQGSETVLVAEDDEAIRTLLYGALQSLGYQVLCASDGQAALQAAESHSGEIHLLVSDLVMPTLGGAELASRLRTARPNVKVIFVSGYAGNMLAEGDLEQTGASFLQKPFSMDRLAHTVRDVLDGGAP